MPALASPQTQKMIDAYLADLRARLRSLPAEQVTEIVEEIRSHVLDTAATDGAMTEAGVNSALTRLGTPSALAASYVTDNLLVRAQQHHMPWTILRAIFQWATLSLKGFLVFLVCAAGYAFGASFFIAALAKPFNHKVGLWLMDGDTYSLVLGMTDAIPRGHELLGWKLIPVGFALGGGTVFLTTQLALWFIQQFRETRSTQGWGTVVR